MAAVPERCHAVIALLRIKSSSSDSVVTFANGPDSPRIYPFQTGAVTKRWALRIPSRMAKMSKSDVKAPVSIMGDWKGSFDERLTEPPAGDYVKIRYMFN